MKKLKKIRVAITGNIGSGKSTFAKFLSEEGMPVIFADDISKDILANDQSVRDQIIQVLGSNAFQGDKVNKKFIAEAIFSDSKKLKKINSILHPRVREEIDKLSQKFFTKNNIVFVEAALIYESKIEKMYDYVVLIASDLKLRMERTTQNKNLTKDEFIKREANQIDEDNKKKKADFTFSNNGTIEELKQKATLLINLLRATTK
ncbi:MAG: dephospho-CoA kinase [bacterium]|nr:dephospho-CoA kinase [bacterium]